MEKEYKLRQLNDAYHFLRRNNAVKTWQDFANILLVSRTALSAAKNGDEKYLTDSLMSKVADLLSRYEEKEDQANVHAAKNSPIMLSHAAPTNMVPVIPYKLYNEVGVNVLDYINDSRNVDVQRSQAIAQFASTSCYYFVNTTAMQPHFYPSDLLALKEVSREAPIVNGEAYLVNTLDLGVILRYIYDRGDHIELHSTAERFEHFNVPKDDIVNLFRVIGLIRTNI